MSVSDPIADMLTIIRNGYRAKKKEVITRSSKLQKEIVRILYEENYINKYTIIPPMKKYNYERIKIALRYTDSGESVIKGIDRVSKPSIRIYLDARHIPVVLNHTGIAIISTNKGIFTDSQARKNNVGGEYICKIW
ncbi:MAG: 30S ribosomal protein S8 [Candidatus Cloacimonadota bacterium]|nr:MAG: 30S ribosomal protein S8 [Candidatus Cloacimonadota bacterium]